MKKEQVWFESVEFGFGLDVTSATDTNGCLWTKHDVSGTLDEHPDCEAEGCEEKELAVYWLCMDGGEVFCEDHIEWTKAAQAQWDAERERLSKGAQSTVRQLLGKEGG